MPKLASSKQILYPGLSNACFSFNSSQTTMPLCCGRKRRGGRRAASRPTPPPCGGWRRPNRRKAASQIRAPPRQLEPPTAGPSCGQKRRAASRALAPARHAKRPKILEEESRIQICNSEKDLLLCSSQIPIWGSRRARSALGHVLRRSSQIHPIWCSKRALVSIRTLPPVQQPNWWRDWTDLGDGPAGLIAERLLASDVADYMCFRAVCRPWRLCCTDPRSHGILDRRFHPRQWIMLRGAGRGSPYRRGFFNVSTGSSRYVDLPELRGHEFFGPTTEGLLVLLDATTYVVRLLNPFTHQVAKLPPATTLISRSHLEQFDCKRNLLSVSGAGLADDATIAVHFNKIKTVAVVKPGDANWIVVDRGTELLPAMSFSGRFYCATNSAVMVVETSAEQPPQLAVAAKLARPISRMMMDSVHLVDNDGELMLVDRKYNGNGKRKYKVYKVDMDERKMVPVRGLCGRAVFIGMELAISVSPLVFPSISADAIYLGFDNFMIGRLDNSPIHLMDAISCPRRFQGRCNLYGPLNLDDSLSWSVTGYRETSEDSGLFANKFGQTTY